MLAAAALAVSVDFFRQLVLPDRRQRSARRQVEVHAELGATGGAETQKIERAIRRAGSHRRALTARLTSSARRLRLTLASDLPGTIWRVGRGRDRLLGAARTLRGLPLLAGVILLRAAVHTARYLGDAVGLADGDLCLFLLAGELVLARRAVDLAGGVVGLRDVGDVKVVYVPYYMPTTHSKFQRDNDFFVRESFAYLRLLNPALTEDDRITSHVGRLRYAQPVCMPGFLTTVPPIAGIIAGLQIADTSVYYPEDRGISESVRIAALLAAGVGQQQPPEMADL